MIICPSSRESKRRSVPQFPRGRSRKLLSIKCQSLTCFSQLHHPHCHPFTPYHSAMASDLLHGPKCSCTPDTHAQCTGCDKTEDIEKMKKCPRCSIQYCSGDCMKNHRKKHQQQCAKLAEGRRAPKRCDARPYTAICFQNFLWDRSEVSRWHVIDFLTGKEDSGVGSLVVRLKDHCIAESWISQRPLADIISHITEGDL